MIQKYYEISCDFCGCAIGHYSMSKELAFSMAEDDGMITEKGKHYCDIRCKTMNDEPEQEQ